MGWQEELRRLDIDLAEGRITPEAHRKQRDDLLAGASGGIAPSPLTSPLRRPTEPMWHSVDPGPPAPPPVKPPPFKPAAPFVTNRRTTAPSPADQRATDSLPYPRPTQSRIDAATVVRPAVVPPPPPPLPAILDAARQQHAPEQHHPIDVPRPPVSRGNGSRPVWLFVGVGVVLVVALIAGGSWWLLGDKPGSTPQAAPPVQTSSSPAAVVPAPTPTPTSTLAPPPGPPIAERVAEPPGVPNKDNSTMSLTRGAELGLYPAEATETFAANGATEIAYRASTDGPGPDAYFILALPTASPANAKAVVDYLGKGSASGGFEKTTDARLTVTGIREGRAMIGTWYASGNVAVTLWVSQPTEAKKSLLPPKLTKMLSMLQKKLPVK
jgi:hypothetical protein